MNSKVLYIFGLLILTCCTSNSDVKAESKNLTLKKVKEIKIVEDNDHFIDFIFHSVWDNNSKQIYCINNKLQISKIDVETGRLTGIYELTPAEIERFYQIVIRKNSNLRFVHQSDLTQSKNHTAAIRRLWFDEKNNELYATLVFQFLHSGWLDDQEMSILNFFEFVVCFKNGRKTKEYSLNDVVNTRDHLYTNYKDMKIDLYHPSPAGGFCVNKSLLYLKNSNDASDTTKLISKIKMGKSVLESLNYLKHFPSLELHRRKDYIFNPFAFAKWQDLLYFTDGKSIFNLDKEQKIDLIEDKFWTIKELKFFDADRILAFEKCDTNKSYKLMLYDMKSKEKFALTSFDKQYETIIFGDDIYRIHQKEESFFLTKYRLQ